MHNDYGSNLLLLSINVNPQYNECFIIFACHGTKQNEKPQVFQRNQTLQKATILFKDIPPALLPSFMKTAMGAQYKKPQRRNISKLTSMGNDT